MQSRFSSWKEMYIHGKHLTKPLFHENQLLSEIHYSTTKKYRLPRSYLVQFSEIQFNSSSSAFYS